MAIQHRDIPESELHEPKGVSTATEGTVYLADGVGSGSWSKIGTANIAGLEGSIEAEQVVVTDGLGGFSFIPNALYGTIAITNNNGQFAVEEADDSSLNTDSDYKIITGVGAPWSPSLSHGMVVGPDGITASVAGVYKIDTWIDLTKYPTNTAKLGIKYIINGTTFGPRKITSKSNSSGDAGNLVGFGLVELQEGDLVQLAIASTNDGTVIFESANLTLTMIRPV